MLWLLFWLLPVGTVCAADSLSAPALWRELQQANVLMAQGKNDSALLLSREVLPKVEACGNMILLAMNHVMMGMAYSGKGEKEQAHEEFARVAALSETYHFQEEALKPKNDFLYDVMLSVYGQMAFFSDEMGQTVQSVEYSKRGMEWANLSPDAANAFPAVGIFTEILMKNGMMPTFAGADDSLSREDMSEELPKQEQYVDTSTALSAGPVPVAADTLPAADSASLAGDVAEADTSHPDRSPLPVPLLLAALSSLFIGFLLWQVFLRKKRRRLTARQMEERFREGQEQERARLARELHDDVSNQLLAVEMKLSSDGLTPQTMQLLNESREHVRRVSHELLPPEFGHVTLCQAIADYVVSQDGLQGCRMAFQASPADADWGVVPPKVALEVYRIVQEAVANALKHAGATLVSTGLHLDGGEQLELTVSDDGKKHTGGELPAGIGLRTMRQRAEAIGARLQFFHHSFGTTVKLVVHLQKTDEK